MLSFHRIRQRRAWQRPSDYVCVCVCVQMRVTIQTAVAVKAVLQLPENLPAATKRRVCANAEQSVSGRDMERSQRLLIYF